MKFPLLDPHDSIGWDFDGVLYDHPKSLQFHNYIIKNQHKKHFIITMRDDRWGDRIFEDIHRLYNTNLVESDISEIVCLPESPAFEPTIVKGKILLASKVSGIYKWKAQMCKDRGITVLVDDSRSTVENGCKLFGITYLHPDDLCRKKLL